MAICDLRIGVRWAGLTTRRTSLTCHRSLLRVVRLGSPPHSSADCIVETCIHGATASAYFLKCKGVPLVGPRRVGLLSHDVELLFDAAPTSVMQLAMRCCGNVLSVASVRGFVWSQNTNRCSSDGLKSWWSVLAKRSYE